MIRPMNVWSSLTPVIFASNKVSAHVSLLVHQWSTRNGMVIKWYVRASSFPMNGVNTTNATNAMWTSFTTLAKTFITLLNRYLSNCLYFKGSIICDLFRQRSCFLPDFLGTVCFLQINIVWVVWRQVETAICSLWRSHSSKAIQFSAAINESLPTFCPKTSLDVLYTFG